MKVLIVGCCILFKEVRDLIFREKMVGEGLVIKVYEEFKVIVLFNGLIFMIVLIKYVVCI